MNPSNLSTKLLKRKSNSYNRSFSIEPRKNFIIHNLPLKKKIINLYKKHEFTLVLILGISFNLFIISSIFSFACWFTSNILKN